MKNKEIEEIKNKVEGLDISIWEDFKTYHELRDLLLDKAFITNEDPKLQKAYFDIFGRNEILEEKLNGILKDILSEDEQVRVKASKQLEKEPRMVVNMEDQLWLKSPKTIHILCNALDDINIEVVKNIVQCLGHISQRYGYDNLSIFKKIISKYDKADDELKIIICQVSLKFSVSEEDKYKNWERIYEVLHTKPKKILYLRLTNAIIRENYSNQIPNDMKIKIKEKVWEDFKKVRGVNIKRLCLELYIELCNPKEDSTKLKQIETDFAPLINKKYKWIIEDKLNESNSKL